MFKKIRGVYEKFKIHLMAIVMIIFILSALGLTTPFLFKNKNDCFFLNNTISLGNGGLGGKGGDITLISGNGTIHIADTATITANGGKGGDSYSEVGRINISYNSNCNAPDPLAWLGVIISALMFLGTAYFEWIKPQ
ncbi:MAG: hypothetical protein V1827_00005 [Candidatus Micrarchaeota archaeon]